MEFTARYKLLTSTFYPYAGGSGGIWTEADLRHMESGRAISPKAVEETKVFDATTDEEALEIAQYIAYHMAKVINPEERGGFSECFILGVSEDGRSLEIPVPGDHYADSATRKYLRVANAEDQLVEIVRLNSDILQPYDWVTVKEKEKREFVSRNNPPPEVELFYEKYEAIVSGEREGINIFPQNRSVVMLGYQQELMRNPKLNFI